MVKLDKKFVTRVFIVALPMIIQNVVTSFAQLVDNLMVGSLGEAAIAGVGASNMIFSVVMYVGFGISEGCSIFAAQQYGAKQYDNLKKTFVIAMYFGLVLCFSAMLFVGFNTDFFIGLFIHGDGAVTTQAMQLGIEYTSIALFSYFFVVINIAIGSLFRATGYAKYPVVASIIAIILNTFLNYIFIFGNLSAPALGVSGAAIATVISRTIEFLILIFLIHTTNPPFKTKLIDFFTVPLNLIKQVGIKAVPLTLNEFGWGFGRAMIMALYGARSAEEFAAMQMANTVANILFAAMGGFSVAVSVIVGQELGRGNLEVAKNSAKNLVYLSAFVGLIMTMISIVLVKLMPLFYSSVSDQTMLLAQQFLFVIGVFFIVYMILVTIFFILRCGGDTMGVLIMDSIFMWIIIVPVTYLLVIYTPLSILTIYVVMQLFELLKLLLATKVYRRYKWLHKIV